MRPLRVVVVDDESPMQIVLGALMRQNGWQADVFSGGKKALAFLAKNDVDVLLTDLRMPGMTGLELLDECRTHFPHVPVVILTGHGDVPLAVDAVRRGASDFLLKPPRRQALLDAVENAARAGRHLSRDSGIIGSSPAVQAMLKVTDQLAKADGTVLVSGETGTGKELVARRLHQSSPRHGGPFVALNIAAIPVALFESELFGHVRGAFTGASRTRAGAIKRAEGGTLFLDEIGELELSLQAKLLRFLQDRTYRRVGEDREQTSNARIVLATHRELLAQIHEGQFREDLFYRIATLQIEVPPLRERKGDLALLFNHFLEQVCEREACPVPKFRGDLSVLLESHPWPGNIRELQNVAQRAVLMLPGEATVKELSSLIAAAPAASLLDQRQSAEKLAIEGALRAANGNKTKAAEMLGISRRSLYNKIEEVGV